MISEVWQSITGYIKDRAVSPLTGAFALSWLAWNHRLLVALFSSMPIPKRFGYIDEVLYPHWEQVLLTGFLFPLASAFAYLLWYHKPALWFYEKKLKQRGELLDKRNEVEKKRLLTVEEVERIRERHFNEIGRLDRRLHEAQQRTQVLEDSAASSGKRISELEGRILEFEASGSPLPQGVLARDEAIKKLIFNRPWVLHFNPRAGGRKEISFGASGEIISGRNDNENTWTVSAGRLLLNSANGHAHSAFVFDANSRAFMMIDEESPRAMVKGQFISSP